MPWQKKVRGKLSKKRYGTGTVPYLPDQTKSTRYSKNFWSGQAEAYRPKLWRIYITYLELNTPLQVCLPRRLGLGRPRFLGGNARSNVVMLAVVVQAQRLMQ